MDPATSPTREASLTTYHRVTNLIVIRISIKTYLYKLSHVN
jgi:hypothetical protein